MGGWDVTCRNEHRNHYLSQWSHSHVQSPLPFPLLESVSTQSVADAHHQPETTRSNLLLILKPHVHMVLRSWRLYFLSVSQLSPSPAITVASLSVLASLTTSALSCELVTLVFIPSVSVPVLFWRDLLLPHLLSWDTCPLILWLLIFSPSLPADAQTSKSHCSAIIYKRFRLGGRTEVGDLAGQV